MEVILLGALMVKYDTVVSTFRNLEPFLNIEWHSEGFYQTIIVLKCLFVFYAMENSIPKPWMLVFTFFSKVYFIYMYRGDVMYTFAGFIFHCVNICFAQMAMMAMLATSSKPFEFLLDVNVSFCTLYYAFQTYRKEIHKLVAIICFSMSVGSYVNNIQRAEIFRFGAYYLLVMLCLATVFPFLPSRKKYGQRLVFYYILLTLWIVHKGGQHCNDEGLRYGSKSDVCSITQHIYDSQHCSLNETLERLCVDDISSYGKMKKVDLKAKKLSGGRKEVKSRVNVKEASCKYNLIPDVSCSTKMYSTEQENLVTEIKEMAYETINPVIGRIKGTEYDRTLIRDMKLDSTEQENWVTEIEEMPDETINPEIGRIEATEYDRESMTDMKLDSTEQENVVTEIEEMPDETINPEIGRIGATEYDRESMTDMKLDSTEQENVVTEIGERIDETINPEIGRIEATEYDRESMTDMKLDSTEQENVVTEIEERIDGTTNPEIRLTESMTDIEVGSTEQESSETDIKERIDGTIKPEMERNKVTENDKASTESYKLRLNFDDKKKLLEEDNPNLEEEIFTENIHDWTEYLFEDEVFSANLFQMNETNGYAEYMDDPSDTTESLPVTEISDDDIDYDFVNRFGNVEAIDNEVRLESANKVLKFKNSAKSEQSHQKGEFVAGIQPLYGNEREEKLTRSRTEIKQTNLQAAETYVGKEKDAIKKALQTRALMGEATKVKAPETGLLELAESRLLEESRFHSTREKNYLHGENGTTAASEYELTSVVKPQNSLLKDDKTRNLEVHGTKLASTIVKERTDAERPKAILTEALDNPNKSPVSKDTDKNKVDSSEVGSTEYLITKSEETCKSHIQESFMEVKATKGREMIEDEYSEPTVSTAVEDCERKFALARYPQTSDYEICKSLPFSNNHEISEYSDYSVSKFKTLGAQNTKTSYKTPENSDKTTRLMLEEDYADRVISSNVPDSHISKKDGDGELSNSHPNAILSVEETEYESVVFADSEITSIRTSHQTREKEKRDSEENNLLSYSNETNAIKIEPVRNYEAKKTETAKFKGTETQETYVPTEVSNTNAEAIENTPDGSSLKSKVKSSKKNEPESININIVKSPEIDPMETNKGSTAESVLSKTLPSDHETGASGIKASESSETEISYSETAELQSSDARESKDDSHIATEELEKTETDYYKEKEREVIEDADPKQIQPKYRKPRWIEEAFTESSKFKATKSNLHGTVQSNPIEGQETGGSFTNSNLRAPTLETKASHSSTREIKTIEAVDSEESQLPAKSSETRDTLIGQAELGASENDLLITKAFQQDTEGSIESGFNFNPVGNTSEKENELSNATNFDARDIKLAGLRENQLKQAEIRHSEESPSGTTRLETTKMVPRISEPKQFKEREIGDFTASENEVSHARIEELEIPKANDPSAREIQPSEAVGPKKSSLKDTKAKETNNAEEGIELRSAKTGVPRTFERKPTKQGEFRYSFANHLNKVNLRQEKALETTTVSYAATEVEPINVANLKDNQFKPAKPGDVETCKSESAICSENIKPEINKAEGVEGIDFEATERSKGFTDVSENLPILVEVSEPGYLNKVSDSEEFGYKAKKTENFGASEIEVQESKESEFNEMGELGKQDIKVNPSCKIESKRNTFQSNGPTVASVPHELKSQITSNGKVPKFHLSEASNDRPNKNELFDGNSTLIQPNVEVDDEKIKAYEREESQPEKEIEAIEDGTFEIAEKEHQETETVRRVENIGNANKKSETSSHFLESASLMSKSDATPIKESDLEDDEFVKAEMVMIDVDKSEKISSKGNIPPHWSGYGDIVATEIHGISATETVPDTYETAETVLGRRLVGDTVATNSEGQKSQTDFGQADGQEEFQSAETVLIQENFQTDFV